MELCSWEPQWVRWQPHRNIGWPGNLIRWELHLKIMIKFDLYIKYNVFSITNHIICQRRYKKSKMANQKIPSVLRVSIKSSQLKNTRDYIFPHYRYFTLSSFSARLKRMHVWYWYVQITACSNLQLELQIPWAVLPTVSIHGPLLCQILFYEPRLDGFYWSAIVEIPFVNFFRWENDNLLYVTEYKIKNWDELTSSVWLTVMRVEREPTASNAKDVQNRQPVQELSFLLDKKRWRICSGSIGT